MGGKELKVPLGERGRGYTSNGEIAHQLIRVRSMEKIINDIHIGVLPSNGRSRLLKRELIQSTAALQRSRICDGLGVCVESFGHRAHRKRGVQERSHIEHSTSTGSYSAQ